MLTVTPETVALAQTFTISRGSKTHAHVLTVRVTRGGVTGWGECVPYARYGEMPLLVWLGGLLALILIKCRRPLA